MRSFLKVFSKLEKLVRQTVIRLFKLTEFGYLLGVKIKIWVFFRVFQKISDEHTYHFYIKSAPPPPPRSLTNCVQFLKAELRQEQNNEGGKTAINQKL